MNAEVIQGNYPASMKNDVVNHVLKDCQGEYLVDVFVVGTYEDGALSLRHTYDPDISIRQVGFHLLKLALRLIFRRKRT